MLSGDDEMTLAVMGAGGDGIISVIANATPRLMSELCDCMRDGDIVGARERHFRLLPWMRRRIPRVESAAGEGGAGDDEEDRKRTAPSTRSDGREACGDRAGRAVGRRDIDVSNVSTSHDLLARRIAELSAISSPSAMPNDAEKRSSTRCCGRWSRATCARRNAPSTARGTRCRG